MNLPFIQFQEISKNKQTFSGLRGMVFGAWFSGQHKLGRWNPPTRFHRKIERLKADHIDHGYVQQTYDDLTKPKGLRSVISLVSILDFWWLQSQDPVVDLPSSQWTVVDLPAAVQCTSRASASTISNEQRGPAQ